MSLVLTNVIQNREPDSLVYAQDLELGLRVNGEERVSFIDLAGNIYPAEIPVPTTAPTLVSTAASATALEDGYYAFRYVYAATTRYPLVDAGIAVGGSIAPRGNPSSTLVVQISGGPKSATIGLTASLRADITEIWVFRSIKYVTSADAQIAGDAGLVFYVGKRVNTTGNYVDSALLPGRPQIELDNFAAPTFKYVRYIAPYFFGIGNEPLIYAVAWSGKVVMTVSSQDKWFDGRNGQIATISGITTGGFDGRGSFYFKVGDGAGNNIQNSAVLTIDGVTPVTLVPGTGTGFIQIVASGSTLFRSKAKNPFSWGITQVFGSSRSSTPYAIPVAAGRATALISMPGDELLKLDFKNPSAVFTYNLKLAAFPEFASTRKQISQQSVSSHLSQFYAKDQNKNQVVWGWDSDTFAILQSDGTSQFSVSDFVYDTLRQATSDPDRLKQAHGFCNEEQERNCMFIPYRGEPNFETVAVEYFVPTPRITDLSFQFHFPTGKWTKSEEYDVTSSAVIRNFNLNKLQIIGGTHFGLLGTFQQKDRSYNWNAYETGIVSIQGVGTTTSATVTAGFFSSNPSYETIRLQLPGTWAAIYEINGIELHYGRITSLVDDTLEFDMFFQGLEQRPILNMITSVGAGPFKISIGCIPHIFKKSFQFQEPTTNKSFKKLFYKGSYLSGLRTYLSVDGSNINTDIIRYPITGDTLSVGGLSGVRQFWEVKPINTSTPQRVIDIENWLHDTSIDCSMNGIAVKSEPQ